jgi:carotenoid cleavage dioxygenase-like enzyme
MSKPIPAATFLEDNFAPWPMEGEIRDLAVEGEIPRELQGAYYRNGPNPQFAPRGRYHWFDGDGMIHGFFIEDGRCDYRNRWVRTERFEREREAGESLFGGLSDMTSGDPRVEGVSGNAANTNIIWHGGRLLALWEAGPPTELDPTSLATRGLFDFDGKLERRIAPELAGNAEGIVPGIMTAHPKVDPDTGELHFFGYSPMPPYLTYMVADQAGRLLRSVEIDVPFASMMHDFIITDSHVIFPVFPAAFDLEQIEKTGSALAWQPDRGTHIGVMPRDGGNADVVWVESDPCYVFHPMNARSDGDRIVAEVARYPKLPFFGVDEAVAATLHRWTIDLSSGNVKEEALDDSPVEFPRFDERFAGKSYRHGYSGGGANPLGDAFDRSPGFDSVFHYDLETGTTRLHTFPVGDSLGEPIFVPRSADAPEGDGFLLVLVHRGAENRSDLVILDATNVEAAPLAKVKLPHRVPYGFHGNWREGR